MADPADPFRRVLAINVPFNLPDSTCLRDILPGAWVTLGELRALLASWERRGEALRGLLLSADASWEEQGAGHDWPEACAAARKELGAKP